METNDSIILLFYYAIILLFYTFNHKLGLHELYMSQRIKISKVFKVYNDITFILTMVNFLFYKMDRFFLL